MALFDNYNSYINTFCEKFLDEVKDAFIHHEDVKGKVYVCAISRKTPKLLDLLRTKKGDIDAIWDKLNIFTEITLPFIDWKEVKRIILIDDAIYFGSTFTAIYQQIEGYAPHVRIIPMCCIRASEAELVFDKDLRTTTVPRYAGHYFVNCLSIDFRKQCSPFEVEFPVFRFPLPKGYVPNMDRIYRSFKKDAWKLYTINNQMSHDWNLKEGIKDYSELGLELSVDGRECEKFRLYVRKGEVLISSICLRAISQAYLFNNDFFTGTVYETPWELIKNAILTEKRNDEVYRTLCIAINFIYSISVFVGKWEMIRRCFSDAFNMNFSKDNLELRSRELKLLFGENIGQAISEWFYDSFNLVYEMQFQELTIEPVEGLETEKEYLPANLAYHKLYNEWQERFLHKFEHVPGILLSEFYLQNFMLDKKNRIFYAVNYERLKYGHTFGSIASLLKKANLDDEKNLLDMHAWIDAQIDAASIVPQYIRVETPKSDKVWLRVFRSGENELHFISHWVRLSLIVLKKELELTGTQKLETSFLSGLLCYIHQKLRLSDFFLDDSECVFSEGSYRMHVPIGEEKMDVLDVLVRLGIITNKDEMVSLDENLFDEELFSGAAFPDTLTDKIENLLEELNKVFPYIDELNNYIPYFDARLYGLQANKEEDYFVKEEDLLRKAFYLLKGIASGKRENLGKARLEYSRNSKSLIAKFMARYTHTQEWYEGNSFKNEQELKEAINLKQGHLHTKGFWVLIQTVRIAFCDKSGDRLLQYIQNQNNSNLAFLINYVAGSKNQGIDIRGFLKQIVSKSYQIWIF